MSCGETHVLVDQEALDLVEHRRVRDVVVAPVDGAAADDRHRRPVRAHLAHLDVAGVRAQAAPARPRRAFHLHPEAVLHVGRRVIGRERELGEVVALELDLGAPGELKAERAEDLEDLELHAGDRVQVSARQRQPARQREVERSARRARPRARLCASAPSRASKAASTASLTALTFSPICFALLGQDPAHSAQERSQLAFLAERLGADCPELLLVLRTGEALAKALGQRR